MKKTKSKNWLIVFAVIGLGLALAGIFLNFFNIKELGGFTLIGEEFNFLRQVDLVVGTDFNISLYAFAILTVIMSGLTLIASLLQMANIIKCKWAKIVLANLTLACAIVTLILTISFCTAYTNNFTTYVLAEGSCMLAVGGFVSGVVGFVNFGGKKRKAK